MEDLYIYTGSFAVIGASIGGPAVGSLIAGDRSIPILLMAIGGAGMLATAGYELLRTDPEEFTACHRPSRVGWFRLSVFSWNNTLCDGQFLSGLC